MAQHLNGSLKGQNSFPTTIGPTDLWAVKRLKVTPGQKIGPTLKWAAKRPKLRSDYKWPIRFMDLQKDERHTGPEISPIFKWVAKRPKDVHRENWPIH